jgi:hypothetical protein
MMAAEPSMAMFFGWVHAGVIFRSRCERLGIYYPSTETEHHKCYFRRVIDQQICPGAPYLGRHHREILALFARAGMKVRD